MLPAKKGKPSGAKGKSLRQKEKPPNEKTNMRSGADDFINDKPTTSTARNSTNTNQKYSKPEIISVSDSQNSDVSDNENATSWTDSKNVVKLKKKYKCPHCDITYDQRHHLIHHIMTTCLVNPDSKTNKESGKFKCMTCGRNYSYVKNLRYHQRHECNQTVTCPDCGKTMQGTFITERHKQNYCVKKRRRNVKQESMNELFLDDSTIDYSP